MRGLEVLAQREYEPGIDVKPSQRSGPLTTTAQIRRRAESTVTVCFIYRYLGF